MTPPSKLRALARRQQRAHQMRDRLARRAARRQPGLTPYAQEPPCKDFTARPALLDGKAGGTPGSGGKTKGKPRRSVFGVRV